MSIKAGVEKIAAVLTRKQEEQQSQQWRCLRNKLDSLLLSTRALKTDDARKLCQQLDMMSSQDRSEHIYKYWGPTTLNKVSAILQQLDSIESNIV